MTKINTILKEINSLDEKQLHFIIQELLKKIEKKGDTSKFLAEYRGVGKGVWKQDAQTFVNEMRNDSRN